MNRIAELLLAETTLVDFKESLEEKKPKSWLKSVSAFANDITGYEIQYATNSSFWWETTKTVKKSSALTLNITKLSSKQKYYVRVRTYKKVSGKTYYSDWSAAKSVTTKK